MEKEIINLNKLEAKDGVLTIIHREHDKIVVHNETGLELSGTIQAPGNFIEKRDGQNPKDRCNVIYSKAGLFIVLTTMENHPLKYKVKGTLTENPDIKKLNINTRSLMTTKELSDLLRFNKFFFADKERNMTIVSNLQKFKLSAQTQIESEDNNRGNAKEYYEIKNDSNIDLTFDIQMPIYVGQAPKQFKVEIAYKVREKNIELWLESIELADLLKEEAERIITEELKRFPPEFVFIEQ